MSASKVPYVKHNNGTQIQTIGLGTYTVSGGKEWKKGSEDHVSGLRSVP